MLQPFHMQNFDGSRIKTIARLQYLQLELSVGSIDELITGIHLMTIRDIAADSPGAVADLSHCKTV